MRLHSRNTPGLVRKALPCVTKHTAIMGVSEMVKMQRTVPQEAGEPRLSIIGSGKLGSPMVAVFAHKGCRVVGVDTNQDFVNAIANEVLRFRYPVSRS